MGCQQSSVKHVVEPVHVERNNLAGRDFGKVTSAAPGNPCLPCLLGNKPVDMNISKQDKIMDPPGVDEPESNADSSEPAPEPDEEFAPEEKPTLLDRCSEAEPMAQGDWSAQGGWSWSDYGRSNTRQSSSAIVAAASRSFQEDGDAVKACSILCNLRDTLQAQVGGLEEWKVIVNTESVRQIVAELDRMQGIGHACCSNDTDWVNVYTNASGDQTMDVRFDSQKPYLVQYRLNVAFPVKLTNALAIAGEVELSSHWNSFLVGTPSVLSRTKGTKLTACSQTSALMGAIKNESLDGINRYIDEEAGLVAEIMQSLEEDSPEYFPPSRGYKRTQTTIRSLWIACGSDHTILRQTGNLVMPFPLSKYLLTTLTGLVSKFILGGLIRNALRSTEPGNPWEEAMAKDVNDFYRRLDLCVQSEASRRRGSSPGHCDTAELASFFSRHQL